jgi:phosphomannomutase
MAPKFGTSGLRGLVTDLTLDLVADHIRAFLHGYPVGTGLFVGRDLPPSSPDLAQVVIDSARAEGLDVTDCRDVPTPALALAAMGAGAAAVMVTGSHIPTDRNGLKFYVPDGEITKTGEAAILAALGRFAGSVPRGDLTVDTTAGAAWVARYFTAFCPAALAGCRINLWSHSAVSRDLLWHALTALGATVFAVWRSDSFISVDAEALPDWASTDIAG